MRIKTSSFNSEAFTGLKRDDILAEAEKRYNYLWHMHSSLQNDGDLESGKALRSSFEDAALVYDPNMNAWVPSSQCVWVETNVKIPGKFSIADIYPLKKTFFTAVLKVSEPTVEMYVDSLVAEAKEKASATHIKETMALICRLGVGKTDLSSLVETKVLPIQLANGVRSFASASSDDEFAVMENVIHRSAFKGKVVTLDFSLEELRDCRPLLLAMGLQSRFSSNLVKEITNVKEGSDDHEMTRNLRSKSRAIIRYVFRPRTWNGSCGGNEVTFG